jgi:putative tryptophan/tyrosine transport system substrate-binding protein
MVRASRRRFLRGGLALACLGLASGCAAPPSSAPSAGRRVRIGFLAPSARDRAPESEGLWQGLRELDRVEGRDLAVEYRYASSTEGMAARAAELVALGVDAIVAVGNLAARAAKEATGAIPVVMAVSTDPVEDGLVASLAHPGGNVTGVASQSSELSAKRLELLKEMLPGTSRVGALWNPESPASVRDWRAARAAAGKLGLQLEPMEVRSATDLAGAFGFPAGRIEALSVLMEPFDLVCGCDPKAILDFAARSRLPALYEAREFADIGGLIAYGANRADMHRRAAVHLDKILKGTRPADLPVEQPITFDLVINLKTAETLGLTIPQSVLQQATEFIQLTSGNSPAPSPTSPVHQSNHA